MSFYEGFEKRAMDPATAAIGATGMILGGIVPPLAALRAAREAERIASLNRMMATGAMGLLAGHTAYMYHKNKKNKKLEKQAISYKKLRGAYHAAESALARTPLWNVPKRMKLKRQSKKFYEGMGKTYNKERNSKLKNYWKSRGVNINESSPLFEARPI